MRVTVLDMIVRCGMPKRIFLRYGQFWKTAGKRINSSEDRFRNVVLNCAALNCGMPIDGT